MTPNDADSLNEAVAEFARNVDLTQVSFDSFSGEIRRKGVAENVDFKIEQKHSVGLPLGYKFEVECVLHDSNDAAVDGAESPKSGDVVGASDRDSTLAVIRLEIVCGFECRVDIGAVSEDVLTAFGDSIVLGIAYPYMREALGAFSLRLGFPQLTLGLWSNQNQEPPLISVRER